MFELLFKSVLYVVLPVILLLSSFFAGYEKGLKVTNTDCVEECFDCAAYGVE